MKIIFTPLSSVKSAVFTNMKPSGFRFEEASGTMKVTSGGCSYCSNGTVADAIGTIVGAINEAPNVERERLLLELEVLGEYYSNWNEEIKEFLDKVIEKLEFPDDWD